MSRKRLPALLLAVGLVCGVVALPTMARPAQSTITVKRKAPKPSKPKIDTFKGLVVRMDTISIIVRDPKNSYLVRTFNFSPELAKKLQNLIDRGGYQSGDKVTIKYADGSNIAQEIKGKASRAF